MGKSPVLLIPLFACLAVAVFPQQPDKVPVPSVAGRGDVTRGRQVFEATCDECHDAYSREERVGPGLLGVKNGKLPDGRAATYEKLLDIVNNGPAEMPAFRDRLTTQQKQDVVAFVMTL